MKTREIFINADKIGPRINKNIYGHLAENVGRCIHGGLYVGEGSDIPNVNGMRADVTEALRRIRLPVLLWPGGRFADEYHWRDGIGPRETRKKTVRGGVTEDNSFGTHEFMELCGQVGCEPYISGNLGSGTVLEMSEWVEYISFGGVSSMAELRAENGRSGAWRLPFFGVGGENCRPEYYADLYRRYQACVRDYPGNRVYKIARGANGFDLHWTETVMKNAAPFMDGVSLRYHTVPGGWKERGKALGFGDGEYYRTLKQALEIGGLMDSHLRVMDKYDPERRVGLVVDEWGTWYDAEEGTNPDFLYQQNTMRDALVAAVTLNAFNRRADRVVMANIAQTVNALQAVILTENGMMLLTPTYHVFDLYKNHQNASLLESRAEASETGVGDYSVPDLDVCASEDENGAILATLANLSVSEPRDVLLRVSGGAVKSIAAKVLTGKAGAHNSFGNKNAVRPADFGPIEYGDGGAAFTVPACAVMALEIGR